MMTVMFLVLFVYWSLGPRARPLRSLMLVIFVYTLVALYGDPVVQYFSYVDSFVNSFMTLFSPLA
jgi:hypothetical protein